MAPSSLETLGARIRVRNRQRSWLLRAPLLAWFVLLFLQHWRDPFHESVWGGMNLAFHEIGHYLFLLFPEFWTVAGGTITQLAIPVVAAALFLRQKEDFGAAVALFWLSTNLLGVSVYAGDARAQALPLVSPFPGAAQHDWTFLLGEMGLLHRDQAVAAVSRGAGLLVMAGSIGLGGWILGLMATDPERQRTKKVAGRETLSAEGQRLREFLESHGAPEPGSGEAPESPSKDPEDSSPAKADALKDHLDELPEPGSLSPEEARLLEFLRERSKDD